jgi:hypothetical protein
MSSHNVLRRLAEMVRDIDTAQDDIDIVLHKITAAAVPMVPGADAAGITVVERRNHVRTVGATAEYAAVLDTIQERHGEGPCLSAAWEQHTVQVKDLSADERWPRYQHDALTQTPCRASLSFRMFTSRTNMGALNLYAQKAGAFDEDSLESGLVLATHCAVLWNAAQRDDQYRSALASRDLIGQAKGMLMERFGIGAGQAFDLLTRLSQESNTKVVDVATRVVEAGRDGKS